MHRAHGAVRHPPHPSVIAAIAQACGAELQPIASPDTMVDGEHIHPALRGLAVVLRGSLRRDAKRDFPQGHGQDARPRQPAHGGDGLAERIRGRTVDIPRPHPGMADMEGAKARWGHPIAKRNAREVGTQQFIRSWSGRSRPRLQRHTVLAMESQSRWLVQLRESSSFGVMRSSPSSTARTAASLSRRTVMPIVSPAIP